MAKLPIYNYADGTKVSFERYGPFNIPILSPGITIKDRDDDSIIVYDKDQTYKGQKSSNDDYELLAAIAINGYNGWRNSISLVDTTLVNVTNPPPPPDPPVEEEPKNDPGLPLGWTEADMAKEVTVTAPSPLKEPPVPKNQPVSIDVKTALKLLGIDLEAKIREFQEKEGLTKEAIKDDITGTIDPKVKENFDKFAGSAGGSGVIDQLGSVPAIATGAAVNTSSLAPFQDESGSFAFPTKIQFGTVIGAVVDAKTNASIPGAKVRNPFLKTATTDQYGVFEIKHPDIPPLLIELGIISPSQLPITITSRPYTNPETNEKIRYVPKVVIPYDSTGKLKGYIDPKDRLTSMGVGDVPLKRLGGNLKKTIIDYLKFPKNVVEEYATSNKTYDFTIQKLSNDAIEELKGKIIPLLLTLVAIYGVSEIKQLVEDLKSKKEGAKQRLLDTIVCPTKGEIDKTIATKNKLVKGINNTYTTIEGIVNALEISDTIITTTDTTFQILKFLPTPTAVLGVGIPISVVNTVQDIKNFLGNTIGKARHINSTTLNILRLLEIALGQVLDILNLLDMITQYCYPEDQPSGIKEELRAITTEESNNQSPIVTNANGFTMGIETEKTTNSLKRRRATATNNKGVVMLRGEYSFSAIEQILIDELVFYIKQNNLKAD